ncbi:hypothetical protein CJP72_18910 [Citrobacter sp. NCU1]|uniref:transposase n=1 Tax=Citrobacter sp. NCU1 TaxID=2026683 RepID=UPI001390FC0C|nr:hypothetical protein [Citrobacter sp. NCU1]
MIKRFFSQKNLYQGDDLSTILTSLSAVLVIKRVFRLTLRAAQGFIAAIFVLMGVPLRCPGYTSTSKHATLINVSFRSLPRSDIAYLEKAAFGR